MKDLNDRKWPIISFCAWAVIATMLSFAIFAENRYLDLIELYHVRQKLEAKIEEIQAQNKVLLTEIEALKKKLAKKWNGLPV